MSLLDYDSIPSPTRHCMVCGRDLADVTKHPSVLDVNESGQPQRRDICPDCWEKIADKDFFSFWLTHREPPKPDTRRTREQLRDSLMSLFERLAAAGEKKFSHHLYILAHMLMKYRLLKWEGAERDENGVPCVVFRNPATDEVFRIPEVDYDEESLVRARREIEAVANPDISRGTKENGDGSGEGHNGAAKSGE